MSTSKVKSQSFDLLDSLFDKSLIGNLAPDFSVTSVDNQAYTLSTMTGKIVLINFWPKKCLPCMFEISDLEKVKGKYEDQIEILILSADSKEELEENIVNMPNGFKFKDLKNFQVPIITNCQGIHDLFGINKYPITLIVNRNGVLVSAEPYLYPYAEPLSNYENLIWEINGLIE